MSRWNLNEQGKVIAIIISVIIVAVLFIMLQNILRPVIVMVVSLAVGLAIAGYYNMLLTEKAPWRMYATGFAVIVPVSAIAWLFLGSIWLVLFAGYTGGLTAFLFMLEARQRSILPRHKDK